MLTKNGWCHKINGVLSADSSKLDSRKPNNWWLTKLGRNRNSTAKERRLSMQRQTEHRTNNLELGSTTTRRPRRLQRHKRQRHNFARLSHNTHSELFFTFCTVSVHRSHPLLSHWNNFLHFPQQRPAVATASARSNIPQGVVAPIFRRRTLRQSYGQRCFALAVEVP